jgi:hypothetical protein
LKEDIQISNWNCDNFQWLYSFFILWFRSCLLKIRINTCFQKTNVHVHCHGKFQGCRCVNTIFCSSKLYIVFHQIWKVDESGEFLHKLRCHYCTFCYNFVCIEHNPMKKIQKDFSFNYQICETSNKFTSQNILKIFQNICIDLFHILVSRRQCFHKKHFSKLLKYPSLEYELWKTLKGNEFLKYFQTLYNYIQYSHLIFKCWKVNSLFKNIFLNSNHFHWIIEANFSISKN